MLSVPISKLRAHFSEYVARVEAGEEVVITKRGAPVARIVAPEERAAAAEGCDDEDAARIQRLVRKGLARAGTGKLPDDFWDLPRPRVSGAELLGALLADREESR